MNQAKVLFLQGAVEIGGAERDLLALLARLNRDKWQPVVACPLAGPFIKELELLDIPLIPMSFPAWRKLKGFFERIPARIKLSRLLDELKPNLIHVNDYYWAPLAHLTGEAKGIPCTVWVRQQIKPERVRQYLLNHVSHIMVVAKQAADVLVASGISSNRISVVSSGIDSTHFHPQPGVEARLQLGIPKEVPVIGCVANVAAVKGYENLVLALSRISSRHPNIRCLIVGREDVSYGKKVRTLAQRLGVSERISFVGFQKDVRPYLAAMDVVVLCSRAEALGVVLLEAMAMAKPVVASRVGGIPEVVEHEKTGILVPPEEADAFAGAILDLLQNPMKCRAMGKAGRQHVQDSFELDNTVLKILQVYEKLIGSTRKSL